MRQLTLNPFFGRVKAARLPLTLAQVSVEYDADAGLTLDVYVSHARIARWARALGLPAPAAEDRLMPAYRTSPPARILSTTGPVAAPDSDAAMCYKPVPVRLWTSIRLTKEEVAQLTDPETSGPVTS